MNGPKTSLNMTFSSLISFILSLITDTLICFCLWPWVLLWYKLLAASSTALIDFGHLKIRCTIATILRGKLNQNKVWEMKINKEKISLVGKEKEDSEKSKNVKSYTSKNCINFLCLYHAWSDCSWIYYIVGVVFLFFQISLLWVQKFWKFNLSETFELQSFTCTIGVFTRDFPDKRGRFFDIWCFGTAQLVELICVKFLICLVL